MAPADIDAAFSQLVADVLRTMALDEGLRADGRGLLDLRPVFCEVRANVDVNRQGRDDKGGLGRRPWSAAYARRSLLGL